MAVFDGCLHGKCTRIGPDGTIAGTSWGDCLCYGQQASVRIGAAVYVLVSDVGLNGSIVHGVFTSPPNDGQVKAAVAAVGSYTGYSGTEIVAVDLDTIYPDGD